jgi:pyruvate/2-oxoglutarate dehydrogenase complex dihydrolipoamide acyltransferase (E2) component
VAEITVVRAPVENVNDETIGIIRWLVDNGGRVEQGVSLLVAETTKASIDIEAPVSGFVWHVVEAGADVPTGSVLCCIGEELEQVKAAAEASALRPTTAQDDESSHIAGASGSPGRTRSKTEGTQARFSTKAMALLQKHGLEPDVFAHKGLVREKDVMEYVRRAETREPMASPPGMSAPAPSGLHPATGVATRVELLGRTKRREISLLRSSSSNVLPSAVTVAVPTMGFLSASRSQAQQAGLASAAIIYEVSRLLRAYAMFNGFCVGDEIHYYERVNVGYALDLGNGLKVPVIQDADRKTLQEISEEKQRLLVDYLNNTLTPESLTGGTFTISDLSADGVVSFQPVINAGQSAILGVCAETFAPGTKNGTFNLVLSFDHQVGEGGRAASFLRDLRERLVAHEASLGYRQTSHAAEPHCSLCLRPVSELEAGRHFLVRVVTGANEREKAVCTICLEDW